MIVRTSYTDHEGTEHFILTNLSKAKNGFDYAIKAAIKESETRAAFIDSYETLKGIMTDPETKEERTKSEIGHFLDNALTDNAEKVYFEKISRKSALKAYSTMMREKGFVECINYNNEAAESGED